MSMVCAIVSHDCMRGAPRPISGVRSDDLIFWTLAIFAGFAAGGVVIGPALGRRGRVLGALALSACVCVFAGVAGVRGLNGQPMALRLANAAGQPLDSLRGDARLAVLADRARRMPGDGAALSLYGEALLINGAYAQAQRTLSRALAIAPGARTYVSWAEAVMGQAGGVLTPDARRGVEAALALDAADPWARSLMARSLLQDGDPVGASALWRDVIASQADAPRTQMGVALTAAGALAMPPDILSDTLSDTLSNVPPDVLSGTQSESLPSSALLLNPEDMIARLAGRLGEDPTDLVGWLRLARAQAVLRGRQDGHVTLAAARLALTDAGGDLPSGVDALLRAAPLTWPVPDDTNSSHDSGWERRP